MTNNEFIDLLNRFEKGLCTPEEQRRLEQWLDNMKEGASPFKSASEKEQIKMALHDSIYRKAGIQRSKLRILSSLQGRSRGVYRIAASILLIAAVGLGLWKSGLVDINKMINSINVTEVISVSSSSDIRKVLLADGSIVWLKPGSKLTYPDEFQGSERVVTLQGEALFEVAKDPEHPFIIHSGQLTTRVLGTSFNIKDTPHGSEVYVLTGKVSVTSVQTKEEVQLLPAEKVVYANATMAMEKEGTEKVIKPEVYIQGTEYNMFFQDTRISEIARRIEGKFDVDVSIEGDIESCVITADFTDQTLANTLDMISEALNAEYEIDEDEVTLKGNGCD